MHACNAHSTAAQRRPPKTGESLVQMLKPNVCDKQGSDEWVGKNEGERKREKNHWHSNAAFDGDESRNGNRRRQDQGKTPTLLTIVASALKDRSCRCCRRCCRRCRRGGCCRRDRARRRRGGGSDARLQRLLERRDLLHHYHRLLRLRLHLPPQLLVLLPHALDFFAQLVLFGPLVALALLPDSNGGGRRRCRRRCSSSRVVVTIAPRAVRLALGAGAVCGYRCVRRGHGRGHGLGVHAAHVLIQVLLARETLARVALTVDMRAVKRILGAAMLAVHLALVPQKAARVCEAGQLLASLGAAFVRPIMLVHVLAAADVSSGQNAQCNAGRRGKKKRLTSIRTCE